MPRAGSSIGESTEPLDLVDRVVERDRGDTDEVGRPVVGDDAPCGEPGEERLGIVVAERELGAAGGRVARRDDLDRDVRQAGLEVSGESDGPGTDRRHPDLVEDREGGRDRRPAR